MNDMDRYHAAAHAVQSGVAMEMNVERAGDDNRSTSPKHLRVGIATAKAEQGGLATLLIAKGVFTSEEYTAAMADAMEGEQAIYERRLSGMLGREIKLG